MSTALSTPFHQAGKLVSRQAEQIIWTYRGWDAFEQARGGAAPVDFDLSGIEGSASFTNRRDILSALTEAYSALDGAGEDEEFLRARIQGSLAYLRVLMGQQMPFRAYVNQTLGVDPEPFPEHEIEAAKREAGLRLTHFDLEMKREDRPRFERAMLIGDPEEIKRGITGDQDLWLARLAAEGVPMPKLSLTVQFTEVDAYWSNWINGSMRKGFTLSINLHARKRYYRGQPLALCLHEICGHAVQMSIWRDRIAQRQMNPACGLTTVHAPEMFLAEGLGQSVPGLLEDRWEFPPEFHLSRALQYHSLLVFHNAHLMIYADAPIEDAIDYAIGQLPLSDPETIEVELRDRGVNPLFRTYQLSYAAGQRAIWKLTAALDRNHKRSLFLEMYTKPMTPSQLFAAGMRIRNQQGG